MTKNLSETFCRRKWLLFSIVLSHTRTNSGACWSLRQNFNWKTQLREPYHGTYFFYPTFSLREEIVDRSLIFCHVFGWGLCEKQKQSVVFWAGLITRVSFAIVLLDFITILVFLLTNLTWNTKLHSNAKLHSKHIPFVLSCSLGFHHSVEPPTSLLHTHQIVSLLLPFVTLSWMLSSKRSSKVWQLSCLI